MGAPGPLVLIVEDEPQMRRFLGTTLRARGFAVTEEASAREGLAQAAGRNPDVGADDYLTKPFGVGELLARIRVALRHSVPDIACETVSRDAALGFAGLAHERARAACSSILSR